MTGKKEFSYTIEKHFGTVSVAGSLPLELNLVSFNGAPARYDLRKWRDKANGEHTMQKGITLNREELLALFSAAWRKSDGRKSHQGEGNAAEMPRLLLWKQGSGTPLPFRQVSAVAVSSGRREEVNENGMTF